MKWKNAFDVIQVQFQLSGKLQKIGDQPKKMRCIDLRLLHVQVYLRDEINLIIILRR